MIIFDPVALWLVALIVGLSCYLGSFLGTMTFELIQQHKRARLAKQDYQHGLERMHRTIHTQTTEKETIVP
jgi:hypothetical protein